MTRNSMMYFAQAGDHTREILPVLDERLQRGDLRTIVVATDSGSTALQVAEKIMPRARVVAIAYKVLPDEAKQALRQRGVEVRDGLTPALHQEIPEMDLVSVRRTLRSLGQGLKVAVEITLMATEQGLIAPGEEVLAVGGTGHGADTVAVVKATTTRKFYADDPAERLEVREVVAMPRVKGW